LHLFDIAGPGWFYVVFLRGGQNSTAFDSCPDLGTVNARPVAVLAAVVAVPFALGMHPPVVLVVLVLAVGVAAGAYPLGAGAPAGRTRTSASSPTFPARRSAAEPAGHQVGTETLARSRPQAGDDDLTAWSDEALYRAWQISYIRLRRLQRLHQVGARDASQIAHLAHARGRYLDELQRRHPAGFSAWVAGRARSSGDSGPFLMPRSSYRPRLGQQEPWTDLK
jgi:hypothetical protein